MGMTLSRKRIALCFLGVVILAIAMRIYATETREFWYDEAFSVLFSGKGPQGILAGTLGPGATASASADIHPPFYYFLLFCWMSAFGTSILAARSLSILLGIGILINSFFLVRELAGERTALLACCLLAVSPFNIQYTSEARMYALLAFCLTLATLSFLMAVRKKKWGWWACFAIASAAAQYAHNLAAFYLLPLAATALFLREKKQIRNTFLAGIAALALYIPWLLQVPAQFSHIRGNYWITRPTFIDLINLAMRYTTNLPLPDNWLLIGLFIAFASLVLVLIQTIRALRQKSNGYKVGLWLAYLSFVPPLLLWLFSQWTPVYLDRGLLASAVLFCLWVAWAILKTPMPKVICITLVALWMAGAVLGMYQQVTNDGANMDAYQQISKVLAEQVKPGDRVIHSNKLTYLPVFYYDSTLPMNFIGDTPGSDTDTFLPATREVIGVEMASDMPSAVQGADRVWFVLLKEANEEYIEAGYPEHPHLQYLQENYEEISRQTYGDVLLYLFVQKSP
jgi:4-amino-4-deoxy-L-arabinose transferase-like glycosyltransferase